MGNGAGSPSCADKSNKKAEYLAVDDVNDADRPPALRGGNASPSPAAVDKARSIQIDRMLRSEHEQDVRVIKVLLLGGAATGKSTLFKQMRILHMNGFNQADLINYRYIIHGNVLAAVHDIIEGAHKFRIVHEHSVQVKIGKLNDLSRQHSNVSNGSNEYVELTPAMGECVCAIWQSQSAQETAKRMDQIGTELSESTEYFLNNVRRIAVANFKPTNEDVLRSRQRTIGIHQIEFEFNALQFRMVDVGGQKNERRKWIHCFDNAALVLFIASLADYDLPDVDDHNLNRLETSVDIFRSVSRSSLFKNTSFILFLNKHDVFVKKLPNAALAKTWPQYEETYGNNVNEQCGVQFISDMYENTLKYSSQLKSFYPFVTTATDTNNVNLVFTSTVDHIMKTNMQLTGLNG